MTQAAKRRMTPMAAMPDPIDSRRTVTGRYAVTEQARTGPDPDRNLALELVRATAPAAWTSKPGSTWP